jgi:hypothetical protein
MFQVIDDASPAAYTIAMRRSKNMSRPCGKISIGPSRLDANRRAPHHVRTGEACRPCNGTNHLRRLDALADAPPALNIAALHRLITWSGLEPSICAPTSISASH